LIGFVEILPVFIFFLVLVPKVRWPLFLIMGCCRASVKALFGEEVEASISACTRTEHTSRLRSCRLNNADGSCIIYTLYFPNAKIREKAGRSSYGRRLHLPYMISSDFVRREGEFFIEFMNTSAQTGTTNQPLSCPRLA
jgi:hypothetical protein